MSELSYCLHNGRKAQHNGLVAHLIDGKKRQTHIISCRRTVIRKVHRLLGQKIDLRYPRVYQGVLPGVSKVCSDFGLLPNIHKRECTSGDDDRTFLYYLYDKLQGKKRFVVERTNAWVKSFKRLRFRFDYKASSFEAFLYLAIIVICVRRLLP